MSKARTVRFNEELDSMVEEYAGKNGLNFNQLINYAVRKYITEPNSIELEPVSIKDDDWDEGMENTYEKHNKAMGELA